MRRPLLLLLPALAMLAACAADAPPVTEEPADGLVRVPSRHVDTVYAAPGMSLATYQRVLLDSVEVEFTPDWQERHPEITATDIAIIRSQVGGAFRQIFGFALSANGGYGLVTQAASDVLRVDTKISGLEVAKPPAASTSMHSAFVVSSSDLELLMELRDAQSGALLVRVIDRKGASSAGDLQIADSVSNSADARRALEMWAGLLRKALDERR